MDIINNKILDTLHSAVCSEGGDGDAIWLAKYISLEELETLIEKFNVEHKTNWNLEKGDNFLNWGDYQEWVTITKDNDFFEKCSSTLKINY